MQRKTTPAAGSEVREFREEDYSDLKGLKNIPDALVQAHLKLYAGYVKNFNRLSHGLSNTEPGTPEWSEMQRRVGFELNGVRLHELYFENLIPGGSAPTRDIDATFSDSWGTMSAWEHEFRSIGAMRGVGWAILYRDPFTHRLSNHWIDLHQNGHPAGFTPILLMDVWEHAFTGMERERYIDAFFANIDWGEVETRFKNEH